MREKEKVKLNNIVVMLSHYKIFNTNKRRKQSVRSSMDQNHPQCF